MPGVIHIPEPVAILRICQMFLEIVHVEPCTEKGRVRYMIYGQGWNFSVTYNYTIGNNDINNVEDELIATTPALTKSVKGL